ncbi:hypothetical protein [Aliidiomarina maris]|uniref:Uncharacterized protein n=1 Tax=Aliidiomarina maris TaxID=531312 RepID=A0A327X560_9GAMM|nr:hypothetical protein [Aliidiomarina maris]RAK01789.1 hypothetical protein B0I24_101423 [Aliidiomarina maris]
MQQATKTANLYLSTLLAGTSAWLLLMAILTHVQVTWAMADMYQQLASSGLDVSWRWWLLFGLSLTLLITLILLGRVGHSGSADDRVFFGLLYDELEESHPQDEAVRALAPPIQQVRVLLDDLRAVASQIQTQQQQAIELDGLHRQLQQQVSLSA